MSTRSLICKKNNDKSAVGIYCHNDGYIENVGFILQTFYNTPKKIDALLELGDLSRLDYRIGEQVDFYKTHTDADYYNRCKNQCIAYHRDKGEELHQYRCVNESAYLRMLNKCRESYNYVYENNQWFVGTVNYDNKENKIEFEPLVDVLKENEYLNDGKYQSQYINDSSITGEERNKIISTFSSLGIIKEEALHQDENDESKEDEIELQ